ncbi:ATP-binding protein [Pseudomonas asplenii]|uniref:ATP-binding protein n=1 Tax=Pseudomonas asplenii TaxID=53407 RepID=UPI002234E984|nr:ATP-binding protein [Pseudomonas asplenii]UZE28709.1 ATP-binding protein [Pseudomonas asplenii]
MLMSITQGTDTLNLRTGPDFNLFSIDSISLLIGPNGSGKTRFLKRTVEQFSTESRPSLTTTCALSFDPVGSGQSLDNWGVVYFNPLPYRPTFHQQNDFIDASQEEPRNLFDLVKHRRLLESFGLSLKLKVKLHPQVDKIIELFANALIENISFQHQDIGYDATTAELRNLQQERSRLSDFDGDRNLLTRIDRRYATLFEKLSKQLLEDFITTAQKRFRKNGKKLMAAVFAVIEHMVEQRKYSIQQIISFAVNHLPSRIISSHAYPQQDIDNCHEVFQKTLMLLKNLPFELVEQSQLHYESVLDTERHRKHFEHGPVKALFHVFLPGMSSGERAVFDQIISLYEAIQTLSDKRNLLVLIDEGDAFLHLAWQRRYIWYIDSFLRDCKKEFDIPCLQLIIASHSPLLASDVPRDFICQLELPEDQHAPDRKGQMPSFAAPLNAILNLAFDASTIGEFATRTINTTIANIKGKQITPRDRYLISVIDDPIIKRELERMAKSELDS